MQMSEDEIRELAIAYGFHDRDDFRMIVALCQDVERKTREAFRSFMQNAIHVADSKVMTGRELDNIAWEKAKQQHKSAIDKQELQRQT